MLHIYDLADAIIDDFAGHRLTYDQAHDKLALLLYDDVALYFFEVELSAADGLRGTTH